jgi:hypothetical protein
LEKGKRMLRDLITHILGIFEKVNWPPNPVEFPTLFLLNLWNPQTPYFNDENSISFRDSILKSGFDEKIISQPFHDILAQDKHIFNCCGNILNLAVLIDKYFMPYARKDNISNVFNAFNNMVYNSGTFNKLTFSHIYNFNSDLDTIKLTEFEIIKIEDRIIPFITGENPNFPSFLHPPGTGNYFVKIQDDTAIQDDKFGDWLLNNHRRASEIIGILQYMKDGLIHVDYTGVFFTPEWVNSIRRPGIIMIGRPRIVPYQEGKYYFLDSQEVENFQKLLFVFYKYKTDIFENKSKLRKAIGHAGNYHELSLTVERLDDRLIDLWISMEALFSPSDTQQLRHSIAENAAFFLGNSPEERKVIFEKLQKLYNKRSSLVHGGTEKEIDIEEVEFLSSLVRQSLLKFTVLQLRGASSINEVLKMIRAAIFDPEASLKLHQESNLGNFIYEKDGVEVKV